MKKLFFLILTLFPSALPSHAFSQVNVRDIYQRNQFLIYLSDEKYDPHQTIDLNLIKLGDNPFIAQDDMTAYYWGLNLIQLTPQAFDKVLHTDPGFIFVACIGKKRLFWGTFCEGHFYNGMVATHPGTTGNIALFKPTKESMKWFKAQYGKERGENLIQLASDVKEDEPDPLADKRIGKAMVDADKLFSVGKPLDPNDLNR